MTRSPSARRQPTNARRQSRRAVTMLLAAIAGVALAALTGLALAKSANTLKTARNTSVNKTLVVDSHGITVYELGNAMASKPLCKKANQCWASWPPLKVASAKTKLTAATGIKGKLGILHRNGIFQVTLGGHPLYNYAGDGFQKGIATGNGIPDFGKVWHYLTVSSSTKKTSTNTTTTTTTTTTTSSTYCYYPPCQ